MKKLIILAVLILFGSLAVSAQQPKIYEPKKGGAERKTLVDAIRVYDVARNGELTGEIFSITALKVQGNWAFAGVERVNLPNAGQGTHLAFLRKSGGKWKLVWSDYNDDEEVGVAALKRLRKKHKDFYRRLADFAENGYLAG